MPRGSGTVTATPTSSHEEAVMAIQQRVSGDSTSIEDVNAIAAVVQLYIDGVARGDVALLSEAFHPDAQLFGAIGDTRYDMPIADFIKHVAQAPADVDGSYRGRITSIVQAGDAAGASVSEEHYAGTLWCADFFTLCRQDGRWRIVNKTFAGGEMPVAQP
jgi:hypothetical protein